MSGIAGILWLRGMPAALGLIERLTDTLKTQGPDALDCWREGSVALGHAALHATPEAHLDRQPLVSPDGQGVIVFDGRLDNREELHRILRVRVPLSAVGDAMLVLLAWEAWNTACPEHLLGDFAFAIWDRHHQRLFLARDHVGARPVYYARTQDGWAFASSDESLLRLPGVLATLDETRVADYLVPGAEVDPRSTWFEGVKTVLPGESICVGHDGKTVLTDYWAPSFGPELKLGNEGDYLDAFQSVFGEAVQARLRTSTAPAAMVSGGLDSASIVAMVRRHLGNDRPFHAYSAVSDNAESCIETRCIRELTNHPGTVAHTVSVPSMTGMVSLDDVVREAWSDCHVTVNSILLPAMMALAAQRQGHKVLLMGTSGDVTMDVPRRYPARYWRQGRPWLAWQESQAAAQNNTYLRGASPLKNWLLCGALAVTPPTARMACRELLDRLQGKRGWVASLSAELAERVHWEARRKTALQRIFRDGAGESPRVKAELVHRWPGVTYGLTGFARAAARHGIEFRDPWADKRVVEFFLQIPLEWQVRQGWTKYLVRKAFASELSQELLWRKGKEHLGWHFANEVMRHERCNQRVREKAPWESVVTYLSNAAATKLSSEWCQEHAPSHADDLFDMQSLALYIERVRNLG